jgi:hypothetical protein
LCYPHQMVAPKRDRHAPVVSCELPDGIQFLYVDDRGRQRTIALEDAGEVDFGRTGPFRKPPAYRGQRNFPGWWWSVTTRSHVVCRSWLERHHIIEADRDAGARADARLSGYKAVTSADRSAR